MTLEEIKKNLEKYHFNTYWEGVVRELISKVEELEEGIEVHTSKDTLYPGDEELRNLIKK